MFLQDLHDKTIQNKKTDFIKLQKVDMADPLYTSFILNLLPFSHDYMLEVFTDDLCVSECVYLYDRPVAVSVCCPGRIVAIVAIRAEQRWTVLIVSNIRPWNEPTH